MSESPIVKIDHLEQGSVLRLVMDKPKGNVLDSALMGALDAALEKHENDPNLKLVWLQGAGGVFSFGASVEEHQRETVAEMLEGFHALVRRMASYPVPLAAIVEGHCLGGGFELALCCHFVFTGTIYFPQWGHFMVLPMSIVVIGMSHFLQFHVGMNCN